jgi:excisionase family DNA binding protein
MSNEVILHQTPIDKFEGVIVQAVSKAVSKAVSDEFKKRNIQEKEANEFLTRKEVAKKLGISLPTLWEWTKDGKIQGARIGTRVRYRGSDVQAALKNIVTKHG